MEGSLGGARTVQRTFDGFKGGMRNFLIWTLLSPTQLFVLKNDDSKIYDDMSMVSKDHSKALEKKMILPLMRKIYEYDKRLLTLFYALAKLWKFWMGNAL